MNGLVLVGKRARKVPVILCIPVTKRQECVPGFRKAYGSFVFYMLGMVYHQLMCVKRQSLDHTLRMKCDYDDLC